MSVRVSAICVICKQAHPGGRDCDSRIVRVEGELWLRIGPKSTATSSPLHKLYRVVPPPMKEVSMPYEENDPICDGCVRGYGMVGMLVALSPDLDETAVKRK